MTVRGAPPGVVASVLALLTLLVSAPETSARPKKSPRVSVVRAPGVVHVVERGETLKVIAERYRTSVASLRVLNRLPHVMRGLRPGQRLRVPSLAVPVPRPNALAEAPPAPLTLKTPTFPVLPQFSWPVEGVITSHFGRRETGWHRGVDISAEVGTPIFAAAAGVVTASGYEHRYGLVVKIEHPGDFATVYAHNLQNSVEVGDAVYAGQMIGQVGRTGRASNYHVHFEIRHGGTAYNPRHLVSSAARGVETADGTGDDETEGE